MENILNFNFYSDVENGPYITITQPSHFTSSSLVKDRLFFKNNMNQAQQLFNEKYPGLDFEPYQAKLESVWNDDEFWFKGSNGVMIIVNQKQVYAFRLGLSVSESDSEINPTVVVDEYPYILPLIRETQDFSHYYVLALNRDSFRLYEIFGDQIMPIELPEDAPISLEETFDDYRNTGSLSYKSRGSEVNYHGHGGAKDERDKIRNTYYNAVDLYLRKLVLLDNRIPIMLFTLTENGAQYIHNSKIINLSKDIGIIASPQNFDPKLINESIQELTIKENAKINTQVFEKLDKYIENTLVMKGLDEIGNIVSDGAIDTLILTAERLATPDVAANKVALQVIAHGGKVVIVPFEQKLGSSTANALLRFSYDS